MKSIASAFVASLFVLAACSGGTGTTSDAGTDGPACNAIGNGNLVVTIVGLPASVQAKVTAHGPAGDLPVATATMTYSNVAGGNYTITAARVIGADPIVRTVYDATVSTSTVCVGGTTSATVTVTYAAIPTSNKLWALNANGAGNPLGYASSTLGMTGNPGATVVASAGASGGIAFDKDGNLWTLDANFNVVRYPASAFSSGGMKTPDRTIVVGGLTCIPGLSAIAFDGSGDLWIASQCDGSVMHLGAAQIAASGNVTPSPKISNLAAPNGIAFDATGNLWVAAGTVQRFDHASLTSSTAMPSAKITLNAPVMNGQAIVPDIMNFDNSGSLWVSEFAGGTLNKVPSASLTSMGASSVPAAVQITIDVMSLIDGFAFDEGGALWTTYAQGKLARLGPSLLITTTNNGKTTKPDAVITSADIGSAAGLAFYPAPSGSPLYAAHP